MSKDLISFIEKTFDNKDIPEGEVKQDIIDKINSVGYFELKKVKSDINFLYFLVVIKGILINYLIWFR